MLAPFLHIHEWASCNLLSRKVSCERRVSVQLYVCERQRQSWGEKDDEQMSSRTEVLHAGTGYRMLAFVVYCNF